MACDGAEMKNWPDKYKNKSSQVELSLLSYPRARCSTGTMECYLLGVSGVRGIRQENGVKEERLISYD